MKNLLDIPRTAMEVFEILPEGTACEVIDNTLYMSPSPTTSHQRLLLKIVLQIQDHLNNYLTGEVFISPCDVYLNDGNDVVQPDVFFIKKEHENIVQKKGIYGSPDIIIEILSSNKVHDQQRKMELYRLSAVPEYIIIDPDTKNIWSYILQNDKYLERSTIPGKLLIEQLNLNIGF